MNETLLHVWFLSIIYIELLIFLSLLLNLLCDDPNKRGDDKDEEIGDYKDI